MARLKITPFLWFEKEAEEAANFYVSLFPDSAVTGITPGQDGSVLVVEFRLAGQTYMAMNGGPHFRLTEAFSLVIGCETQAEVDEYWEKLPAGGGTIIDCGWLKDKYGLTWQVVPTMLLDYLAGSDRAKAARVMQAMMTMTKMDIAALQTAADAT